MKNLWQQVREFIPMAAVLVLCLVSVPSAQASTNNSGNATTTATLQSSTQPTSETVPDGTKQVKAKPKATRPASKSVLDDEVLNSPFSYFQNAFFSQEDSADATPSASPVMVTVKALIATLLSTIL